MPREHGRNLRVAAELHRLLNEVLRAEVKDPRLHDVTINDVEVSGDLGVAKIYYATLDPDEDPREAQAAFRKAAGFLRSRIGQAVRLRRVPELHFVRDTSARRGFELSQLIDSLHTGERADDDAGPEPDDAGNVEGEPGGGSDGEPGGGSDGEPGGGSDGEPGGGSDGESGGGSDGESGGGSDAGGDERD